MEAISSRSLAVPELAYAIGAMLGDGHLSMRSQLDKRVGRNYPAFMIHFSSMDREVTERVAFQLEGLMPSQHAPVREHVLKTGTVMYEYARGSRELFEILYFATNGKTKIPEDFRSAPIEVQRELIAGIMDTDGFITKGKQSNAQYVLGLNLTNFEIVRETAAILQQAGVKIGMISESQWKHFSKAYRINPNIRSFVDAGFYFHCLRKADRLCDYLRLVRSHNS